MKEGLTLRLPKDINAALTKKTNKLGLTKNGYILNLIINELEKDKKDMKKEDII